MGFLERGHAFRVGGGRGGSIFFYGLFMHLQGREDTSSVTFAVSGKVTLCHVNDQSVKVLQMSSLEKKDVNVVKFGFKT